MQGAGGAKTEGRMARVGKGFDPRSEPSEASPKPHPPRARDQAGLMGLEGLAARLRRHAAQVGRDRAEQRVVLTDGGTGLDDVMDIPFPHAERIRDSYHAAEHLGDLAKADGSGEAAAAEGLTGVGATGGRMREGAAILATLEVWDLKGRSAATREAHRSVMGSVRKDLHRMDYPRNREEGWRIGSGPIEAACQTVVHQRPKRSGMRRGCDGADETCQLRAWDEGESGRWDALWERSLD